MSMMIPKFRSVSDSLRNLIGEMMFIATTSIVLINVAIVRWWVVGAIASSIYIVFGGYLLGKAFFNDEKASVRFMLGVFLLFSLFILGTAAVTVVYELNISSLAGILFAPLVLSVPYSKLRGRNLVKGRGKVQNLGSVSYFSPLYNLFIVPITFCLYLLVKARSGWVYGTVWDVMSPTFFLAYFSAAFGLVLIILFCNTRASAKMVLIAAFSLVSTTIFAVVLYPGNVGDPFSHMGWARMIVDYGSLRGYWFTAKLSPWTVYWLLKAKGLALLTATVAKMSLIDVYWVHTFITPVLWGVFIPLTAYKIAKTMGWDNNASVLAAFLTTFYSTFVTWGSRSTANSLGYVSFFLSLSFSLQYLKSGRVRGKFILAMFFGIVSAITHPLTGIMSFILIFLAIALKRYQRIRPESPRTAYILIFMSFLCCILTIPAIFGLNNIVYLYFAPASVAERYAQEVIAFSSEKLLRTDMWNLLFEEYADYSFREAVIYGTVPFMGIVGIAYALKKSKHGDYDKALTLFMFLAFLICLIDYRILEFAMTNVLFSALRIVPFTNLILVPFSSLTILSIVRLLGGALENPIELASAPRRQAVKLWSRRILAGLFIGLSVSALAVPSIYESYAWLGGMQPTELEVEAVKYIDEHTDKRYVVITMPGTEMVGEGFAGTQNPEKYYVFVKGQNVGLKPSVEVMLKYMRMFGAEVGYFIASTFRTPNFDDVVVEASRMFGLFNVLKNTEGEIHIFQYKIPPLPPSPDVMAFYWDAPTGYFVQNDLVRIVFNPKSVTLEVADFWGDLYESINLNETLLDGKSIGNVTLVEYYNPSKDIWVKWSPDGKILLEEVPAMAQQFKFRLGFESGSLIGVVESGNSSIQMMWEDAHASSLRLKVGDFQRLYIPGLIGGAQAFDVNSLRYGFLYTASLTKNVTLHPAYRYEVSNSSLTYRQIVSHCNLSTTKGYMWYDFYVDNNAMKDQWAYVEVWLPDEIWAGIIPHLDYSVDEGETWLTVSREPIKTIGGLDANWVISMPRQVSESPTPWIWGPEKDFILPNFTDSGGAQNRLIFGVHLPPGDEVLIRLKVSVYWVRPLEISYVFTDSDDISYGLHNMNEPVIKFYNLGSSEYVGGLTLTERPTLLIITQDEWSKVKSMVITIPPNTAFSLLSAKEVNTKIDSNPSDGIPDAIQGD